MKRYTYRLLQFFFISTIMFCSMHIGAENEYHYWKKWLKDQENNYQDLVKSPENASNAFLEVIKDKPFFWGASTSHYQYEGGYDKVLDKNGNPADSIEFYAQKNDMNIPGLAVDLWDNYKTIIPQLKKELGINMLRISIGWSRVEPDQGNFNQKAINRYVDIVKTLKLYGIEPFICFHHYTNPQWFMDAGDFVKFENIHYFVTFCTKMYSALAQDVKYYSTMNGVQSYGLRAYYSEDQVPYEKNLQKAMQVTAHILEAHVEIYQEIKKEYTKIQLLNPTTPEPLVGIQVIYHPLDPVIETIFQKLFSPLTRFVCWIGKKMQNAGVFSFFKTGVYEVNIPGMVNVNTVNPNAPYSIDFIALNAYANRPMVGWKKYLHDIPQHQKTGSTNYYACPQILYRATKDTYDEFIKPMKEIYGQDIPIFIAENGISTKDEAQREWYYKQVIIAIQRAIKDGYPLSGYLPWTATDCFEWRSGKVQTYGQVNVTFEGEQGNEKPIIGTKKDGIKFYVDFVKKVLSVTKKDLF